MAAGVVAMAGLATGCRIEPQRKIVPQVLGHREYATGLDQYFATTATRGGYAMGVLARSYDGRPVKLEGNPKHPASLGAIDSRTIAEIAVLYDPDRLQSPTLLGDFGTWEAFLIEARNTLANVGESGANGIAILTPNVSSPTLAGLIQDFLAQYPNATWHQYEPVNRDNVREGAMLAFGTNVELVPRFDLAKVVVGIDADIILDGPAPVRYQRDLAANRFVDGTTREMSRLYALEAVPTLFGAMADHRYRVRPSRTLAAVKALAAKVGVPGAGASPVEGLDEKALNAMAADLLANRGASIVTAGTHCSAAVHAVVNAINSHLGNIGTTLEPKTPVMAKPTSNMADIRDLATKLSSGQIKFLLVLEGNPVYDAPADLNFKELLGKAKLTAHLSLYDNETSAACRWQLPCSHFLEAWGDGVAFDHTYSVGQPLIMPLYDSRSPVELLAALLGRVQDGLAMVRQTWTERSGAAADTREDAWAELLAIGAMEQRGGAPVAVSLVPNLLAGLGEPGAGGGIDLLVLPDPTVYDGRYSNVGWLQELPKPLTDLTWDNAIEMGPALAQRLGVTQVDRYLGTLPYYGPRRRARISANGQTLEGAVYVNMGMADETVVVRMGYGRTKAGQIGTAADERHGGGFDAMVLRTTAAPNLVIGAQVEHADGTYALANAQFHNMLEVTDVDSNRDVIRKTSLAMLLQKPDVMSSPTFGSHAGGHGESHGEDGHGKEEAHGKEHGGTEKHESIFIPPQEFYDESTNYQWAMTIDLNLCTGCNACVTACQAENNIPVVGKEQVQKGREMHWIRIDRYYMPNRHGEFNPDDPAIALQPVTCVQCELAPCEPVCPVAATTHSHEGINQMVYNRCVGTRYCSNNCPYKVRRFNFLFYQEKPEKVPVLQLAQNPNVTVRGRGVMEKCTMCVHRINEARIDAKKHGRKIQDGEVRTACQQACPTGAIVFGNKGDRDALVSKHRQNPRNYSLLGYLNTRPRVTHLGRVNNPHPELEA
ncbi:MAG: 4Fe-4S dicluster domain-containing protein [Fimbriimonadaceae bacterium]|nr:4Fe-4S dicluster domain-containing protein [Fimbriimonadaceae bacterium]QYK57153.1 MAG: 4Fe-4S dicluster domain-containing protein [Fimbriimonadaceae bacterium]